MNLPFGIKVKNKTLIITSIVFFVLSVGTSIFIIWRLNQADQVTPEESEAANRSGTCDCVAHTSCDYWLCGTNSNTSDPDDAVSNPHGCCSIDYNNYCNPATAPLCGADLTFSITEEQACDAGEMAVCNYGVKCEEPETGSCVLPCEPACAEGEISVDPLSNGTCPAGTRKTRGSCEGCNNPYWGCCRTIEATTTTTTSTTTTSTSTSTTTSTTIPTTTTSTSTTSTTTTSSTSTTTTSSTTTTVSTTTTTVTTTTSTLPDTGIFDHSAKYIILGITLSLTGFIIFIGIPQIKVPTDPENK